MRVRRFEDADEDVVVGLWQRCALVRPWNDPRKDIARKRKVQRELFLVAELEGAIVASAMGGYEGHRGWVNYLAVDVAHRGLGLGRALMSELETRLRALGCPKVNLQVRDDNAEALAFYGRLGYLRDAAVSLGKRLESDEA
ncbi:MAG TPA: GNAT family acetyltransferase [Myxococcota bacterium]|nr:GNAT family acetyltransferase [Myxococcota bacterium]